MRKDTFVREEVLQAIDEVSAGRDLSIDQVELLLRAKGRELNELARAANEMRRKQVGDIVTFVINRNINYTNVCVNRCKFCAFGNPKQVDFFLLSVDQIRQKVKEAVEFGATEVCIQGGINPGLGLDFYVEVLRTVREVSEKVHIHAFSPEEIDHISRKEDMPVKEVLLALKREGLGSIPGTAAEILVERVRKTICPNKISVDRWVEIIETAHSVGIPSTCTILYGTVETEREVAEHLLRVRDIQRKTGGFTEFIPLPFVGKNTELGDSGPSLVYSLKLHAVSRLVLGKYIRNLQASWVKLGPRGAQAMLLAGANDLGGTLMEENITRLAGGRHGQLMPPERFVNLIKELGRRPAQRTTLYEILRFF